MKKILALTLLLLVLSACLVLTSCGGNNDTTAANTTEGGTTTTAGGDTTTTTTTEPSVTPSPAGTVEKTDTSVAVTSLGGKMTMTVNKKSDGFTYTLTSKDGGVIIAESALGLKIGSADIFEGATIKDASANELKVSYNHLGNFSTMTDHCIAATVTLDKDGYEFALEIKLYDDGVAFRYNLPKTSSSRKVAGEATAFSVANIGKVWYGAGSDCYEDSIKSATYANVTTSKKLTGPLMIELADKKGYVALMEGNVLGDYYIGTNFASTGENNTFKVSGSWSDTKDFESFNTSTDIISGWRVINYSTDLGAISLNNNIYHTALGMDGKTTSYTDTDWITPGKSIWSWLCQSGDRVTFDTQIGYTLGAAKLGFAYNLIDDGYTNWEDYEDKLLYLGLLGEDVNVKQILWCGVTMGGGYRITSTAQAVSVMKTIADLHLSGIKLDFFNAETNTLTLDIQEATLTAGMEHKLVVNFHGCPKPTAQSVLYPNELTREAIRGLECLSRTDYKNQAAYITAQFYTRLLAGHADFTPDVNTAMQIGSLVILDSPLAVLAAHPDEMLANPAVEMIRAMPTVWDRTVFLDGEIAKYVSIAKEADGVWYIGGITTASRAVTLDLSKILGDGEYLLTGWVDASTSKKNQMTQTVTKDTKLDLGTIKASCGYVFQITKLAISQHGGEITGPITVKTASSSSVVKYTIDGSDPMTSTTAITAGESITLTDTCKLRIAIVDGDGKGTQMSYQFNKIAYNGIEENIEYNDGSTKVTLTPTLDGAKLYYTLDGTTPTASSTLYTAPITLTETATLKVIAISAEGKASAAKTYTVAVTTRVSSITPDVYLDNKPISAQAGWGSVAYDKSMNNTTLSLGGISTSSGTKFEHGISANATATFVYNIPEGASEFVGVAGIDDSNYSNTIEGHKASTIVKIYFGSSSTAAYTTVKLGCGQYEQIRVEIPEGATTVKIVFGDAGDGITCDNVDLCDAGFILAD